MSPLLPSSITAAVLSEPGKPLDIVENIGVPELGPFQVLVRIFYSGVCHSQLQEVRGGRGVDRHIPHMLGHEATGEVVLTGTNVGKVRGGDRVVLSWIKGSGGEAGGTRYADSTGRIINAGAVTTFSDYAVVSENRLTPLPPSTPLDLAVLYGCAIPTGAGIVFNEAALSPDSIIVILGLGGVGISALMAAATIQTKAIIAIDVSDAKLVLARELGATHLINASSADPLREVRAITGGNGVDLVVEASGFVAGIEQAFKLVRPGGGELIFASHPREGEYIRIDPFDLIRGKKIRGSWGGASVLDRDIPRFDSLYTQGKLPLSKLISHRYNFFDINRALSDLEERKIVRALIEICPIS